MMLMMRHHGDDVYLTSQLCCGLRNVAAKFWGKNEIFVSNGRTLSDIWPSL